MEVWVMPHRVSKSAASSRILKDKDEIKIVIYQLPTKHQTSYKKVTKHVIM
jgi:hypothetical protein